MIIIIFLRIVAQNRLLYTKKPVFENRQVQKEKRGGLKLHRGILGEF